MNSLFGKPLKFPLNPKDRIVIFSAETGRILNAEVGALLSQDFDLGELGNQCLEYPIRTATNCETGEVTNLPLQIADVLLAFETLLCSFTPNSSIDIVNETFTYNGIDNVFVLADPAFKVINVYIDNATFPSEVPVGQVTQVTIVEDLILNNKVTIQYIKA